MDRQYPLIFLTQAADSVSYTTPQSGGGTQDRIPQRDRLTHGERLKSKFERIWQEVAENNDKRAAVSLTVKDGLYFEFRGSAGYELITSSLEHLSKKIRLLNVREGVENDEKVIYATVYVPSDEIFYFQEKITKYLEEDRKSGKPWNAALVNSIENVRLAILESFWTDPLSVIPNDDSKLCELWIKTIPNREEEIIEESKNRCKEAAVEVYENRIIRFPERVVLLIRANKAQLIELIQICEHVAELRLATAATNFFFEQSRLDQLEWVNELTNRVKVHTDNVRVTILDTGVSSAHPLLAPILPENKCLAFEEGWGTADHDGHGTLMAGVAAYGSLEDVLAAISEVSLSHNLGSVKILPPTGSNSPDLYGYITQQAISLSEIESPYDKQIFCCAVTSTEIDHQGKPTSWSGAIDSITSGEVDGERRLFVVSAGNNIDYGAWLAYPNSNLLASIHDPAQSWNALTVGANTQRVTITSASYGGHSALAPNEGISPYTSCSTVWDARWPIKPDIVVEGGNLRMDPRGNLYENFPDLSVLSTNYDFETGNQFDVFGATSAASAKASWMCGIIQSAYPTIWPETVKGLLVHSAEWPQAIIDQYGFDISKKSEVQKLMRVCGYGAPNLERALYCKNSALTYVSEETIQPFKLDGSDPCNNQMHLYELPWPKEELLRFAEMQVQMRITLSYFVEPSPAEVGWKNRYRYASHGLRFDVNSVNETRAEFEARINAEARDETFTNTNSGSERWLIGRQNRSLGAIHSDVWNGTAADIASCNNIAIYPVIGWWRERKHIGKVESSTRYSLIVSLRTPTEQADVYTPIASRILTPVEIQIENQ